MADFTIEINRGQGDEVSLTVDKVSSNGLAFTWAFEHANIGLADSGGTLFTDEPDYLESVLVSTLKSWRKQQQNEGVKPAYEAADDATQDSERTMLGL